MWRAHQDELQVLEREHDQLRRAGGAIKLQGKSYMLGLLRDETSSGG